MLTLKFGPQARMCDGTTRRGFLKLGASAIGGFTLADLLKMEAQAGVGGSHKAVINIHQGGGPSHQDTFDLKPQAPVEFRGEFNPIKTNVPGVEICEYLPKLAAMADQFTVIRSLVGSNAGHSNFQTHTGYNQRSLENVGGRPSMGAVVSRLLGSGPNGAPAWISYNKGPSGFLGPTYRPYAPGRNGGALKLNRDLTEDRMSERTSLLSRIDGIRREMDKSGRMEALDSFTQRAMDMVISGRVGDAVDLKKEDPAIVERYGRSNENLLRARRLIQAGVRCITMNAGWGNWDTHPDNFNRLRTMLPKVDQGMSTLIWDLQRLGMLDDVVVVMWGEFGRTPRINNRAGRDHWPKVSPAFIAGGGLRHGQAIGATDRIAAYVKERPVHFQEVFATVYHVLGIDSVSTKLEDPNGRPQYLLDHREPIRELV